MSKFGTKGVDVPVKVSKYIEPGNDILKIVDIKINYSGNKSKQVTFEMESSPVKTPGFKGQDGAEGRVGRVQASIYLKDSTKEEEFVNNVILRIAIALDVRDELDNINADTLEEYLEQAKPLITGKLAKWCIAGEEYLTVKDGRVRTKLKLPRYDFVGDLEGKIKVATYSKENKYHYKKYESPTNEFSTSTPDEVDTSSQTVESSGEPF